MPTIQVADKHTLDATKENTELLKEMLSQSSGGGYDCTFNFDKNTIIAGETKSISTLPYNFYDGRAVVYNNEIHILGGSISCCKYHYKWDGTSWTKVSTLPYEFYLGSAVVYNDEIHILGSAYNSNGVYPYTRYHYKWDGTSWTKVSTLPYDFYNGSAVVYNNEIHILGSSCCDDNNVYYYAKYYYKWNGTSWTSVSTLPYEFYLGSAVVYNNEIHILGGSLSNIYKFNGVSWISVGGTPYYFRHGNAVVYNDEIHILGSSHYDNSNGVYPYTRYHYKWDGTSWTSVSTLPYDFKQGSTVIYNDGIHILGSSSSSCYKYHYTSEYTANSIQLYLQSGSRIICDIGKIFPISDNLEEAESGYICKQTGLCKLGSCLLSENSLFTII